MTTWKRKAGTVLAATAAGVVLMSGTASANDASVSVLIKASDPKYDADCVTASVNVDESIRLSIKVCNYQGAKIALCGYKAIPGRPSAET